MDKYIKCKVFNDNIQTVKKPDNYTDNLVCICLKGYIRFVPDNLFSSILDGLLEKVNKKETSEKKKRIIRRSILGRVYDVDIKNSAINLRKKDKLFFKDYDFEQKKVLVMEDNYFDLIPFSNLEEYLEEKQYIINEDNTDTLILSPKNRKM